MSLHNNASMTLPKTYTRLNVHTSDCTGTYLDYPERSEKDAELTEKISPESRTFFSVFDEGACGEPQTAQHLIIDFTHNEMDNDFVQKKCCAFWEFIESHPEIHHLMVMPDSEMYPNFPTSSEDTFTVSSEMTTTEEEKPMVKEHTAVSMLDFVSREGLIDKSFEAKIPQAFCPLGSREYIENQTTRRVQRARKGKPPAVCRCGGKCNTCRKISTENEKVTHSSEEVSDMCDNLRKWDLHHPKSMEPPGRAIPLIHCVMQRKVS